MGQHQDGDRTGKLLTDPEVWYPVSAVLDGVDPWSESPIERLKFLVYQRRQMLAAIQVQLLVQAHLDPKHAAELLANYLSMAVPIDPRSEAVRIRERASVLEEVANMGPIKVGQLRVPANVDERPASSVFHR